VDKGLVGKLCIQVGYKTLHEEESNKESIWVFYRQRPRNLPHI